jgi:bacillithiol system protein YtxJ
MGEVRTLERDGDLDAVLSAELVLIFKHSPICALSWSARNEVDRVAELDNGVPIYWVDVIGHRDLSSAIAAKVGVTHQSPQAILLRRGVAIWHASHRGVLAEAIAAAVSGSDRSVAQPKKGSGRGL